MQGHEASDTLGTIAAARFQRELYQYWRAVRVAGGLALGARGYLTLAAWRRLVNLLPPGVADHTGGDEPGEARHPRLVFCRRLLERLDLLERRESSRLVAANPVVMAAYLEHPLAERVRGAVRLWVAGGWWLDLLDPARPLPALRAPAPPRVALARRHLLHDLLTLEPGAVLGLPVPPLSAGHAATTRAGARRSGRRRAGRVASPAAWEGETERAALLGPLRWLGLVVVAEGEGGQSEPWFCQATRALDALREPPTAPVEESGGRIVIQPNFDIVAYPPHTAPALYALDVCADAHGVEHAARYTLTRRGLARARRMGWPSGSVVVRLEALAGGVLPQNVAATLRDWDRQVDRLLLRRAVTLVEVRDAALLDGLQHDRHGAGWVVRRLTPRAALIDEQHIASVRAWLLRQGEMPALKGAGGAEAEDVPG